MNPPPPPKKKKNVPDFHVEPHRSSDCFEHLYKSLLKSRHPKKYLPNFPTQKDLRMENLKPKKGLSSRTLRGQIEDNTVSICSYSLTKPDRNKITHEHLSSSHWKESKLSCILHCMFCMYVLTEKFRTLNVLNFSVNFSNFEKHFLFQMERVINHWFCGNKFPESCLKSLGIIS